MFVREALYVPVSLARQYGGVRGLRRHQLRGVNRMLGHATATVPFYRSRAAYHRPPLTDLAELAELPLITKDELRSLPQAEFVADGTDTDRCVHYNTSGTTGQRIRVMHDRDTHDYHMAAAVRRFLATGRYRPTHRLTHLRGLPLPPRRVERLGIFRRHQVPTYLPMDQIRAEVLGHRPHVLLGFPVHLRELGRALSDDEFRAVRRHLRCLMTESELLVPEQREWLVSRFGVPVFDDYSAFETLGIYFECAHGGRHLNEDRLVVEVLDDEGRPVPDGTPGQIVCTPFMARAMPLIRYALGDVGVINPTRCRCRRRLRTLRLTRGRVNDFVQVPNGRRLYAEVLLGMAMHHPGVAECFVRQDAAGAVRFAVVPDGTVPFDQVRATVRDRLLELAGGPFPLEVVAADAVPISEGYKGRFVESDYRA